MVNIGLGLVPLHGCKSKVFVPVYMRDLVRLVQVDIPTGNCFQQSLFRRLIFRTVNITKGFIIPKGAVQVDIPKGFIYQSKSYYSEKFYPEGSLFRNSE